MSKLFVDEIVHQSSQGSGTITLGASGETVSFASGVTGLNYPAFEAYLSANQSISDSTDTKIQYDTEALDTDNCYDNTTNYRFTPNVSGKYFVYGGIRMQSSSGGSLAVVYTKIYKNGSAYRQSLADPVDNQGNSFSPTVSATMIMNGTTDYVELWGFNNVTTGTPRFESNEQAVYFGAYRIGS